MVYTVQSDGQKDLVLNRVQLLKTCYPYKEVLHVWFHQTPVYAKIVVLEMGKLQSLLTSLVIIKGNICRVKRNCCIVTSYGFIKLLGFVRCVSLFFLLECCCCHDY